jgi:protein-S-isoprenylcysteine O-methyltransferase Ste14
MRRWLVPAVFAILAVLAGIRALHAVGDLISSPDARGALTAIYFLLRTAVTIAFAVATVARPAPLRPAREPAAFVACAVAMLLVIPAAGPSSSAASGLVLTGDAIALLAGGWTLFAVLALGNCFSVLPEARGMVVRGPYRYIRHPVYLGEIGMFAGLTLAAFSLHGLGLWGAVVLLAFVLAQFSRMRMEETALTDAFPAYAAYAAETGRLLPRLPRHREPPRRLDFGLAPPSASSVVAPELGR